MDVLAPMVRLGTLPLRLLALERGAALVYTEEIVDSKLAGCTRSVDSRLGTIDWRAGRGIVLRTCDAERGRLIVQIGTADVQTALAAITALAFDPSDPLRDGIVGIDINMGCPKHSAVSGGSGSALFADSERAESVVRAVRNVLPADVALSCKVRLHENGPDETLRRCLQLVAAGASSIAIHARHAAERACDLARWLELSTVAAGLRAQGVTEVLLNGDVLDAVAASQLRRVVPGCRLMVGRGALHAGNGIFGEEGRASSESLEEDETALDRATLALCTRYAQLAIEIENPPLNSALSSQFKHRARLPDPHHATFRHACHISLVPTAYFQHPTSHVPRSPVLPNSELRAAVDATRQDARAAGSNATAAAATADDAIVSAALVTCGRAKSSQVKSSRATPTPDRCFCGGSAARCLDASGGCQGAPFGRSVARRRDERHARGADP